MPGTNFLEEIVVVVELAENCCGVGMGKFRESIERGTSANASRYQRTGEGTAV
jgi:hypothetical protein